MMTNLKIWTFGLLVWLLSTSGVAACPTGNPNSLDYISRENNRCEGILDRSSISGSLYLASLAVRGVDSYGDTLTIRVPKFSDTSIPSVILQSLNAFYKLDSPIFDTGSDSYNFTWSTYVLREAGISPDSLRAVAKIGPQITYVPVLVDSPANEYEIVFYSSRPVRFNSLQIKRDSSTVYEASRSSFQHGEILFTWDGRNEPAGSYTLEYEVDIEERGYTPRSISRSLTFVHNPDWLR